MFIDKTLEVLHLSLPLLIVIGVVIALTCVNLSLVTRIERIESRGKGKTKYRTSDLWFDFLEEKKLQDIDIHEEDFAGYISALNTIVLPSGTFSKRNLIVKFIVFHEAMHYYCNQRNLFTHNKTTKIVNIVGLSLQLGFIPYLIAKSLVLGTPIYQVTWLDISILFIGWVLNSVPLLIEEAFVSYHAYKFLTRRITMKKEYKKELIRFGVYAWLSHFTVSPYAVNEEVSRWVSIYYHKKANRKVLAEDE